MFLVVFTAIFQRAAVEDDLSQHTVNISCAPEPIVKPLARRDCVFRGASVWISARACRNGFLCSLLSWRATWKREGADGSDSRTADGADAKLAKSTRQIWGIFFAVHVSYKAVQSEHAIGPSNVVVFARSTHIHLGFQWSEICGGVAPRICVNCRCGLAAFCDFYLSVDMFNPKVEKTRSMKLPSNVEGALTRQSLLLF